MEWRTIYLNKQPSSSMHMIRVLLLLFTAQPFYLFGANICLLLLRLVVKIGWRFLWSHCEAFYGMYLCIIQHQSPSPTLPPPPPLPLSVWQNIIEKYKWIQIINASNMKFNETRCQMSSDSKICDVATMDSSHTIQNIKHLHTV